MNVILVTGDRNWGRVAGDRELLDKVLDALHPDILVEGEARGADRMSREWAERNGYRRLNCSHTGVPSGARFDIPRFIAMPANWTRYGRAAGPIRNAQQRMLLELFRAKGWVCAVHAFHRNIEESKGTKHMIADATKHGFEVTLHA